jgi:hypothetical protein
MNHRESQQHVFRQMALVTSRCPGFVCRVVRHRRLVCRGELRPTPLSEAYRVRLEYETRRHPQVFVEQPRLTPRVAGERVPHTYGENEPCLFKNEWNPRMSIVSSVIPWAMLWLTFYEAWRVTGEWQGGGVHPEPELARRRP